jgi:hypothetical protein
VEIHNRAKAYATKPSVILGIRHPVEAYFFDRAVYYVNTTMEEDVQSHSKKAKGKNGPERAAQRRMRQWMDDGSTPQKFADPVAMGKVKIRRVEGGQ